jgi:hypothetical protein|tara:strand:+ start:790 stop:990 length:201 start_codon:yes stop_codon:yes gene_type:complete
MFVIVRTDPEHKDYPLPDVLMDDDGSAKTFIDEDSAWRYMELICKEHSFPPKMFMEDVYLGLMRVH